jgi:hypothetical protein
MALIGMLTQRIIRSSIPIRRAAWLDYTREKRSNENFRQHGYL